VASFFFARAPDFFLLCPIGPTLYNAAELTTAETHMTLEEMKSLLDKSRQYSKENAGKVLMCSDKCPAGFDLIHGLIQLVEQQQKEIDAMKAKFIT